MTATVAALAEMEKQELNATLRDMTEPELLDLIAQLGQTGQAGPTTSTTATYQLLRRYIDDELTTRLWDSPSLQLGYASLDYAVTDPAFDVIVLQSEFDKDQHGRDKAGPFFPTLVDVAAVLLTAWADLLYCTSSSGRNGNNNDGKRKYIVGAEKMFGIFDQLVTNRAFFTTTESLEKAANRVFRLIPTEVLFVSVWSAGGMTYNVTDRILDIVRPRYSTPPPSVRSIRWFDPVESVPFYHHHQFEEWTY